MLKKIGMYFIMLMAMSLTVIASADDFENVVGYKDALNGDGFPPPLSEMINAIGRKDKVRVAINSKNDIKTYIPNNTEQLTDDVSIITINTDEFQEFFLWNNNYQVSFSVANNSVYQTSIFIYYDSEKSIHEQEKVLMRKTKDYLESVGFKDHSSWYSRSPVNKHSKGNLIVEFGNAKIKTKTEKFEGLLITINNQELKDDVLKLAKALNQIEDLKIKEDLKPLDKIFK